MTSCSESWTSPIATNALLDADRQRLRDENEMLRLQLRVSDTKSEALTTRVRELTEHSASLRDALHAILRLQRVVDDDRNDDEAEEESLLELYELRRWRQQFAVEQTRYLVDRLDTVTAYVHRLEHVIKGRDDTQTAVREASKSSLWTTRVRMMFDCAVHPTDGPACGV